MSAQENIEQPAEEQKPEEVNTEATEQPAEEQKLKESLERIEKLEKRLDDQSRIMGKYENANKKLKQEPKAEGEEAKPEGEYTKFTELQDKVNALEARDEARLKAIEKAKLAQAIVANGGDPVTANDHAEFLAFKNREEIKTVSDEIGEVSVTVGAEDTPVGEWVKMFMSSDEGKFLNTTKRGPSAPNKGQALGTTAAVEVSSIEYAKNVSAIENDHSLTLEQKESKIKAFKMK